MKNVFLIISMFRLRTEDGSLIISMFRLRTEDGSLIISMSKESDQGSYQCIASNIAGTRSSHKANLSVYGKMLFKFSKSIFCFMRYIYKWE